MTIIYHHNPNAMGWENATNAMGDIQTMCGIQKDTVTHTDTKSKQATLVRHAQIDCQVIRQTQRAKNSGREGTAQILETKEETMRTGRTPVCKVICNLVNCTTAFPGCTNPPILLSTALVDIATDIA